MQEQMKQLYELQQVDSGIAQHHTWIAGLDDGGKSGRSLARAKQELEAARQRLQDLEATNRQKELELKSADDERKARAAKAYGGTIADTKELAALERKIEELDRKRDKLEDDILKLMDDIEATRAEVERQEKIVGQGQAIHDKIVADYEKAKAKLEDEIQVLAARRAELAPEIEADLLQEYEAARAKLDGIAVAGIEGNMCKACRNVLPQSALSTLKVGTVIVKCQNCRRMLYPSEAW
jgi:hypothetical protein